jgi:ABC-2 type transport system permease protein
VGAFDDYGIAMVGDVIFNSAIFSANSFMEERIKKPNMRLIHSPVRPFYIHFSKVLAAFAYCAVTNTLVAAALHFVFRINYGGDAAWSLLVIMLLSVFLLSSIGVLVCCMLKSEGITNDILSLLFALFAVLGGVFFPIDGLGGAVSAASWVSPAKWIMAACMRIVYDRDFSLFMPVCGLFIALTVAAEALSCRFFRGEDYI